ncbi:MAG: ABC transporter permease [Elusimicrobia bacterium]|nr:ABC transporter permease [Candidatus Liberimonas magnetica]
MNNKIPDYVGLWFLETASELGKVANIIFGTFYWVFRGAINWRNTVIQMVEVGWASFPVVFLTSLFTGMVLALQMGSSMKNMFNEPIYLGSIVCLSLVRELGPVLTCIVISGRIGAAIAAEIGTMRVTEQIDALYTLGTDPVRYLAVPRFLACMLMIPILVIFSNIIGTFGGLLVTMYKWNIPYTVYWNDITDYIKMSTFMHGFIKTFIFSGIIVFTSYYKGTTCSGGAEGVGRATTNAVMVSMVLILVSDYFISAILVALGIA